MPSLRRSSRSTAATPVIDVMTGDVRTVPENACLETVFADLQRRASHFIGVVDRAGRFIGYMTPENISELVMIRTSATARRAAG